MVFLLSSCVFCPSVLIVLSTLVVCPCINAHAMSSILHQCLNMLSLCVINSIEATDTTDSAWTRQHIASCGLLNQHPKASCVSPAFVLFFIFIYLSLIPCRHFLHCSSAAADPRSVCSLMHLQSSSHSHSSSHSSSVSRSTAFRLARILQLSE